MKLDDDELKTIEEVFMKASVSLHSDGSGVGRVTTEFPEEDVELVPGLKITNMNFTGVVK